MFSIALQMRYRSSYIELKGGVSAFCVLPSVMFHGIIPNGTHRDGFHTKRGNTKSSREDRPYMLMTHGSACEASLHSKPCLKWPLSKRSKTSFQDQLSLKAGQKYCRVLQGEHSATLLTCIKLPFVMN